MRLGLLQLGVLPLLLVGCTSTAPSPPTSPPTVSATSKQPVAAVVVPAHLEGEISRNVYTGTSYDGHIGEVPRRTKQLELHLACAGPADTEMQWEIQDGKSGQYSSGTITCDGHEYRDTDQSKNFPSAAVIHLDAASGVINGWAILTGS